MQDHQKCSSVECGTGKLGTILQRVENTRLENTGPTYRGWKTWDH